MTKHARGDAMRGRILAELRRRRDAWEPEPSQEDLARMFGSSHQVIGYHLRVLRAAGLVHPSGLLITPKGHGQEN